MNQQKLDKYMMEIAKLTASMSKATKLQVGAVFERDGRPLCTGWNGILEGIEDDSCEEEVGCSCSSNGYINEYCSRCYGTGKVLKTKDELIHAEMNALRYMAKAGISTKDATLYITHSPCINCAKHIAGIGLKRIVYNEEYKSRDGIELLQRYNIKIEKLEEKEKHE